MVNWKRTIIIHILGNGCSRCKALEQRLLALQERYSLAFELQKITELQEIMAYGGLMTPGLVMNSTLKSVGTVPRESRLLTWLKETSV